MNVQKLTQKSIEAVNCAQQEAKLAGNPDISQMHMFYALLKDENSLISQLLKKSVRLM